MEKVEILKCIESYLDNGASFKMLKCGKIILLPKEHKEYENISLSQERQNVIYQRMENYKKGETEIISPEDAVFRLDDEKNK